jgi:hypothetical protein
MGTKTFVELVKQEGPCYAVMFAQQHITLCVPDMVSRSPLPAGSI